LASGETSIRTLPSLRSGSDSTATIAAVFDLVGSQRTVTFA
jgi:hypothetical protein